MPALDSARTLFQEGRFREALAQLGNSADAFASPTAQILRAELLERLGKHSLSEAILQRLIRTKSLVPQDQSAAEHILGRISNEDGRIDAAITHFQRAVAIARKTDDLARACWSGFCLIVLVAERLGPEAAAPLVAQVRADVIKLGNPAVSAGLHVYVSGMEAKRGLLRSAERHLRLAQAILNTSTNLWLESVAENTRLAIAVLRADLDAAFFHARRGLDLAEESGAVSSLRACLGNLGNLFTIRGDFDRAVEYIERSLAVLPSSNESSSASLDSLARIRLSQGRLTDCEALLEEIEGTIRNDGDRALYAHRYAALTRTHLLAQKNRIHEALIQSDLVQTLAQRAHDKLLSRMALLARAELLLRAERHEESLTVLTDIAVNLEHSPPDLYARSEGIIACGLGLTGRQAEAEEHLSRAERIYEGLQSAQGLMELRQSWTFCSSEVKSLVVGERNQGFLGERKRSAVGRSVLHSIAAMLLHVDRTEWP